jgi:hypothetical protein
MSRPDDPRDRPGSDHPDDEVLAEIALGTSGTPDDVVGSDALAHAATCARCGAEVEGLRAVADELRAAAPDPTYETPSPRVWDAIAAETSDAQPDGAADGASTTPLRPSRVGGAPEGRGPGRRGRAVAWLVAAAAVVGIVLGVAGDRILGGGTDSAPPPTAAPTRVVATVPLTQLDGDQQLGDAKLLRTGDRTELQVHMTAPESPDGNGFREVWLINTDGTRMVSLGVLAEDTETFVVPADIVRQGYRIVDVSSEPDDGDPTHSGASIMRGELPA